MTDEMWEIRIVHVPRFLLGFLRVDRAKLDACPADRRGQVDSLLRSLGFDLEVTDDDGSDFDNS